VARPGRLLHNILGVSHVHTDYNHVHTIWKCVPSTVVVLLLARPLSLLVLLQAAAGDTKKLYSLHFWAISEQRSRPQKEDFHEVLPYLSACFAAPGQPAQQAQPPPQPQQQPQAAAGPQQQQPQQQQQHPALAPRLKLELLTAAARIGGWWQPTAEADGGAAQQLALQALKECFGDSLAAAVASIARWVSVQMRGQAGHLVLLEAFENTNYEPCWLLKRNKSPAVVSLLAALCNTCSTTK